MELSKTQMVMKALVEDALRRDYDRKRTDRTPEDIDLALNILNLMIPPGRLRIIADTSYHAQDFASVLQRSFLRISHLDQLKGYEDPLVQLHTGRRTAPQQDLHMQIQDFLQLRSNVLIWHVGEWR